MAKNRINKPLRLLIGAAALVLIFFLLVLFGAVGVMRFRKAVHYPPRAETGVSGGVVYLNTNTGPHFYFSSPDSTLHDRGFFWPFPEYLRMEPDRGWPLEPDSGLFQHFGEFLSLYEIDRTRFTFRSASLIRVDEGEEKDGTARYRPEQVFAICLDDTPVLLLPFSTLEAVLQDPFPEERGTLQSEAVIARIVSGESGEVREAASRALMSDLGHGRIRFLSGFNVKETELKSPDPDRMMLLNEARLEVLQTNHGGKDR